MYGYIFTVLYQYTSLVIGNNALKSMTIIKRKRKASQLSLKYIPSSQSCFEREMIT